MYLPVVKLPPADQPLDPPDYGSFAAFLVNSEVFFDGFLFSVVCLLAMMVVTVSVLKRYYQAEPPSQMVGRTIGWSLVCVITFFQLLGLTIGELWPFHLGGIAACLIWLYYWQSVYPRVRALPPSII